MTDSEDPDAAPRPGRRPADKSAPPARSSEPAPIGPSTPTVPGTMDPVAVVRSRQYISALILAALIGLPISFIAFGFLAVVGQLQEWIFTTLPESLFGGSAPAWWPVPWLTLCGLLTAMAVQYLPGNAGHSPALGFVAGGAPAASELPGIVLAALASLSLGAVVGPEAPLIAIGAGLGALAARAARRDAPATAVAIIGAAGSFAAISTLLGSPLLGAFLIMETAGIGGATLGLVVLPGLLAAGIGNLIFVGIGSWTGLGTYSLTLPDLPAAETPTLAELGYAIAFGVVAAVVGWLIRRFANSLRPIVHRGRIPVTAALGLLIGVLAMAFQLLSGEPFTLVLFSGENALPFLISRAGELSAGVIVLLLVIKALAYGLSLSAFRGGPVFPSMLIGAAVGMLAANLPGMDLTSSVAMGIGALCAAMLRLPLTSVLLATLLLGLDGVTAMPVVIVAVTVSYVVTLCLPNPVPSPATVASEPP